MANNLESMRKLLKQNTTEWKISMVIMSLLWRQILFYEILFMCVWGSCLLLYILKVIVFYKSWSKSFENLIWTVCFMNVGTLSLCYLQMLQSWELWQVVGHGDTWTHTHTHTHRHTDTHTHTDTDTHTPYFIWSLKVPAWKPLNGVDKSSGLPAAHIPLSSPQTLAYPLVSV